MAQKPSIITFTEPSYHPRRKSVSNAVSSSSSPHTSSRALSFSNSTSASPTTNTPASSVFSPSHLPSRATSVSSEHRSRSQQQEQKYHPQSQQASRATSVSSINRTISFAAPFEHEYGPSRWNREKEERLKEVGAIYWEHQRRWSEGQAMFEGEVEALEDDRSGWRKFTRRRSKDHKREGVRVSVSHELPYPDDGDGDESASGLEIEGDAEERRGRKGFWKRLSGIKKAESDVLNVLRLTKSNK